MLLDRIAKLQEWESNLQQHRLASGVRVKPMCVIAYGGTGVGKSTIAPLLMYHLLQPNGFDASDDACIMMKAGQKHEENYRTYINGVYYDDFANTNPDFVQESPCEDLLDTVNTARCTARMASLELKNKVSKQPKAVVVSTNVKTLNAEKYSEEPASIIRRADAVLTFRARPEFLTNDILDSKKIEAHYDGDVPFVPDLWEIDVEVGVPVKNPTPGRPATIGFKTVVWNGKPLKSVDMQTALQFLVVASRQHFALQKQMVERSSDLKSKLKVCETCQSSESVCVCGMTHVVSYTDLKVAPPKKGHGEKTRKSRSLADALSQDEAQFEESLRENPKYTKKKTKNKKPWEEHALATDVLQYVNSLSNLSRYQFKWLVPQRFVRSYASLSVLKVFLQHPSAKYHTIFVFFLPFCVENRFAMLFMLFSYMYLLYVIFMSYVHVIETNVAQQKQASWHYAKHCAKRTALILGTGVAAKVIFDMAKAYFSTRSLRQSLVEQSYLAPTDEEIAQRDANDVTAQIAEEHNWANVVTTPLPSSTQSKTIAEDDLVALVARNTACIVDEGRLVSNMFFIKSNVAVVPTHLIKRWKDKLCVVVRNDVGTVGGNFKCFLSYQHSAQIPNTDLSVVWVPNGGSWKDLTKYFPQQHYKEDFGVRVCTRDITGANTHYRSRACYKPNEQLVSCVASGYSYNIASFVGMCEYPLSLACLLQTIGRAHV